MLSCSEFLSHLIELIIESTRLIHYSYDGDDVEQILQSIQRDSYGSSLPHLRGCSSTRNTLHLETTVGLYETLFDRVFRVMVGVRQPASPITPNGRAINEDVRNVSICW